MNAPRTLVTERLVLRQWRDSDLDALAVINSDPAVMRHFLRRLTRTQTANMMAAFQGSFVDRGFGPWAVEAEETGELIGFAGLFAVRFDAHFTPATELVARFAVDAWRQRYATEACVEAIRDGFERVGLSEIVAFTARRNRASWRGMESLGMAHDEADDFAHPDLPADHPLSDHVLYRLVRPAAS